MGKGWGVKVDGNALRVCRGGYNYYGVYVHVCGMGWVSVCVGRVWCVCVCVWRWAKAGESCCKFDSNSLCVSGGNGVCVCVCGGGGVFNHNRHWKEWPE